MLSLSRTPPGKGDWEERIIAAVAREPALREVIISGGDALMLPDAVPDRLLSSLREIPHYLFACDPVRGTGHFRVDTGRGAAMMDRLWRRTSGLCLPRYVLDSPGAGGKVLLAPLGPASEKEANFFDKKGKMH